jgi:hypothetical protein
MTDIEVAMAIRNMLPSDKPVGDEDVAFMTDLIEVCEKHGVELTISDIKRTEPKS